MNLSNGFHKRFINFIWKRTKEKNRGEFRTKYILTYILFLICFSSSYWVSFFSKMKREDRLREKERERESMRVDEGVETTMRRNESTEPRVIPFTEEKWRERKRRKVKEKTRERKRSWWEKRRGSNLEGRCFCEKAESFGVWVKEKERESLLAFTCRIPDCERAMAAGRVIGERTEKSMRVTSTFGSPERMSRGIFLPSDTLFLKFSLSFLFLSSFHHQKKKSLLILRQSFSTFDCH